MSLNKGNLNSDSPLENSNIKINDKSIKMNSQMEFYNTKSKKLIPIVKKIKTELDPNVRIRYSSNFTKRESINSYNKSNQALLNKNINTANNTFRVLDTGEELEFKDSIASKNNSSMFKTNHKLPSHFKDHKFKVLKKVSQNKNNLIQNRKFSNINLNNELILDKQETNFDNTVKD